MGDACLLTGEASSSVSMTEAEAQGSSMDSIPILLPRSLRLSLRPRQEPEAEAQAAMALAEREGLETATPALPASGSDPGVDRSELEREFAHHEAGVARVNHGSFGSCPSSVQQAQRLWAGRWLAQPDEFYYEALEAGMLAARTAVAGLVNARSVEELVLVDNATVAAAIVGLDMAWGFMEGRFRKGDAVLMLDCAYGAVRKSVMGDAVRAGAQVLEVKVPIPASSAEEVLGCFRAVLEKANADGVVIRLAVIDHVVSMPTLRLPVKQVVSLCRKHGVEQVFVDGAHAIGSVELDVQDVDADYYTSNLHKWLFAPISAAFLHSKPQHLVRLHHPVVSHAYGKGLALECNWVGTRDYSSLLAVPAAIDFVNTRLGGIERLRTRNHERVIEMAEMLARSWGTHLGAPPEMYASMAMVALPACIRASSEDDALALRTRLRDEFRVEVPIYFNSGASDSDSTAYARISHQVYNTETDYNRLRDAVLLLCQELKPAVSEARSEARTEL